MLAALAAGAVRGGARSVRASSGARRLRCRWPRCWRARSSRRWPRRSSAATRLRFAGRLAAATLLFMLAANVVTSQPSRAPDRSRALLGAAALVGAIAVLELAQVPSVLDALEGVPSGLPRRRRPAARDLDAVLSDDHVDVSRGRVRARPGVDRARAASAFVGAALVDRRRHHRHVHARRPDHDGAQPADLRRPSCYFARTEALGRRAHRRLAALAAILVALVLVSRSPQMLVTRMSTEGSQDWYGASYEVPPTLTLRPGQLQRRCRHAVEPRLADVAVRPRRRRSRCRITGCRPTPKTS